MNLRGTLVSKREEAHGKNVTGFEIRYRSLSKNAGMTDERSPRVAIFFGSSVPICTLWETSDADALGRLHA